MTRTITKPPRRGLGRRVVQRPRGCHRLALSERGASERLDKDFGFIAGGNMDRAHHKMARRQRGAKMAWDWLDEHGAVKRLRGSGRLRVVKIPRRPSARWLLDNVCHVYGADAEIGWYRLMSAVGELKELGKSISPKKGVSELIDSVIQQGNAPGGGSCMAFYRLRRGRGDFADV